MSLCHKDIIKPCSYEDITKCCYKLSVNIAATGTSLSVCKAEEPCRTYGSSVDHRMLTLAVLNLSATFLSRSGTPPCKVTNWVMDQHSKLNVPLFKVDWISFQSLLDRRPMLTAQVPKLIGPPAKVDWTSFQS